MKEEGATEKGVIECTHYSEGFYERDDGWWYAECVCGWNFGAGLPSAEDAADALMDHVYQAGLEDGLKLATAK